MSLLSPKTIFLFNQACGRLDRDFRTIVCRYGNGTFLYDSDQIFSQPASTLQIILGQAKSITHVRIETTSTYSKDHASIKTSGHQDHKTSSGVSCRILEQTVLAMLSTQEGLHSPHLAKGVLHWLCSMAIANVKAAIK